MPTSSVEGFQKLLFKIWPPSESKAAEGRLPRSTPNQFEKYYDEAKGVVAQTTADTLAEEAKRVQDAEIARQKSLEDKGQSFVVSAGLAVSVISLVSTLFSEKQELPFFVSVVASFLYLLAILHFVVAARYGLKARGSEQLLLPSASNFLRSLPFTAQERVADIVAQTKWNEPALSRKSNYVQVAEVMFIRGLFSLMLGLFLVVGGTAWIKFEALTRSLPYSSQPPLF